MKQVLLTLAIGVFAPALTTGAAARDGDLDPAFGAFGSGKTGFTLGSASLSGAGSPAIAAQSSGELILAGSAQTSASNVDFGAIRISADGLQDFGFGASAARIVAFDRPGSSLTDSVEAVLVLADDSILLAGEVAGDDGDDTDMAVAKLTSDGQIDAGFGASGKALVPFNLSQDGSNFDTLSGIDAQDDGMILLAGSADTGFNSQTHAYTSMMAIARLAPNGLRDTGFDLDGRVAIGFGGDDAFATRARPLADGGHILVVGGANTAPGDARTQFALARLDTADGSLDPAFGAGGKAIFDFGLGTAGAVDFTELPDGRLMVCGAVLANEPENYDFACMRFLADGRPDPDFAPRIYPFDLGDDLLDIPRRMRRDRQGRFVLAGYATRDLGNTDCAVARIESDGRLDPAFGTSGRVTLDGTITGPVDYNNGCTDLLLQADGGIVVAGIDVIDAGGHAVLSVSRLRGDTVFADGFEN